MKKILSMILGCLLLTNVVHAATATPAATTTPEETDPTKQKQLDDLKERLATKVAQLRQSQKKAIYGTVKAISVSTLTVETQTSELKIELTDEITVFQMLKGKRTKLTTDDLEKNDFVVVFGDYDSNLDLLKAKVIVIQDTPPTRIFGTVTEVNRKDFTITVLSGETSYIVDIETTTKNFLWARDTGVGKGAFSKILAGNMVYVLGTPVAKAENRLSALRILDVGNTLGITPTPSLIPTKAASPSATSKTTVKPTPTPTP